MIDIKLIREDTETVKRGIASKNVDPRIVDQVLLADRKKRELLEEVEHLREQRNKLAKLGKPTPEAIVIKKRLTLAEEELKKAEEELEPLLRQIPNLPLPGVPVGKDEGGNVEIRRWGTQREFTFAPKDHLELGKNLQILDFETGAKVTGSQFYYLYNEGALLELALVQYAMNLLGKDDFIPVITPDLAKSRFYLGTGYSPRGNEAQTYEIKDGDLGLIATAEITLAGKQADEIIPESSLPLKYIGYSHCFRKEAGAYGKYSKGLYRVHQFTKAEIFIYCTPEESDKMHSYLLSLEENIYQNLEIPYRVLEMCTGDLGAMAARKFDVEAWMPGRDEYGEVTSTSNCTDYQARNLNIRFKRKDGTNEFIHMLNGTAIATSRTLIALLENHQQEDGSVLIPPALQPYTGFSQISGRHS